MISRIRAWFEGLPTAGKLLVILSAAVLPLGAVLIWAANSGIAQANAALSARAKDQGRSVARALDSRIARSVLALRVAANGAFREGGPELCDDVAQALSFSPNVPQRFTLRDPVGTLLCAEGDFQQQKPSLLVRPGQVRTWVGANGSSLYFRVGVNGGIATGALTRAELSDAVRATGISPLSVVLSDGVTAMALANPPASRRPEGLQAEIVRVAYPITAGQLTIETAISMERVASIDRLIILLPVLMWIAAALMSWWLVNRFLIQPLRRMQRAVTAYEPGSGTLELPAKLGAASEIRELGSAFSRAVERIEENEHRMADALEGQRKLVREVHHRVKNNLQVVASLLNIHGRSATTQDARDAYSSIGRRVDALAVVHRNHYAELEANRGIALRPLLSELAASLRGSAPDHARTMDIELELESLNSTQDVAVAVAFLTTEIVEFAMLREPEHAVQLKLHRTTDLTARFSLCSPVLNEDANADRERVQFERIVGGLARQLRSTLDKEPGSYGVELPVFPPRTPDAPAQIA